MHDDDASFADFTRGIRSLKQDRADTGKRAPTLARSPSAVPMRPGPRPLPGRCLSDAFVIDVGAEDELYWGRDGVQDTQLRRLKGGQIPFEGSLDLHGMTVEKAGKPSGTFSPRPPAWKSAACASPMARPRAWTGAVR